MDNQNSSLSDLDLNPDMMTSQAGTPTVISPPVTTPVEPVGVIDITPGKPEQVSNLAHLSDITSQSAPTQTAPTVDTTTLPSQVPAPEVPLNPTFTPAPTSIPLPTPPVNQVNPVPDTPSITPPATNPSPLVEDPDLVKLIK